MDDLQAATIAASNIVAQKYASQSDNIVGYHVESLAKEIEGRMQSIRAHRAAVAAHNGEKPVFVPPPVEEDGIKPTGVDWPGGRETSR